ncbi:MAG: DUF362 domain-containing protein [Candidatus Omnitrophota bacterium]|jgi:uncharacterized protein (DUF362 family)/Pyruvate/2-oxoacid:ferredoxin oxidoreductase delta subunit
MLMKPKVSLVRCTNYEAALVSKAVKEAVDLIGGITNFIRPQSRVLVKPNLLLGTGPESGITTHPEVVRAVIKLLKGINCKIFLGDAPWASNTQIDNVDEVYKNSGMKMVSEEEGIELVKFDKRRWREKFPLAAWLDHCDYLVSIPKLKTHEVTVLTAAIKNLFGLVSGPYRLELHKKYFPRREFARMLVDVYQETRPALTVVDGITAMEGDGPGTGGKTRQAGLLLAGSDAVALDSVAAIIMGIEPFSIPTTREAARRGLGEADIAQIEVLGEKLKDVIGKPFQLPVSSMARKLPRPVVEIAKKLIRFYPKIDDHNCIRCGTCIRACPKKVISMRANKVVIDYRGCISCFCCQEACPASAIKIKRSLLAKIAGL